MVHHRSSAGFMKISALGVEEQRVNVVLDVVESSPAARASLGDGYRVEVRVVTWESPSMLKVATSELCATGEKWGSVGSTTSRCGCPDHSAAICRSRRRSHATPLSLENATSTGNGPYIPDHTEGPKAGRVHSWLSLPHCPTWTVRLTALAGYSTTAAPGFRALVEKFPFGRGAVPSIRHSCAPFRQVRCSLLLGGRSTTCTSLWHGCCLIT